MSTGHDWIKTDALRAGRWGVKSVGGLVANLALLTLWVDVVGIAAWWAVGINWLLVSLAGYVVTDRWVFRATATPGSWRARARRYAGMQSVMASAKVVNYVIYLVLLPLVDYRVAWVIGAAATFLWTFGGNRELWT